MPSPATLQLPSKHSASTMPVPPVLLAIEEEERMAHLEDGHWSPPDGYQSSTSNQRADGEDWPNGGNFGTTTLTTSAEPA